MLKKCLISMLLLIVVTILSQSQYGYLPEIALADGGEVCHTEPVTQTISTTISANATKSDILFAFDSTGSMEKVLSGAKDEATQIMAKLSALTPDTQFAVVDFRDYPVEPFGEYNDFPYLLRQSVTDNSRLIQRAINQTYHDGGKDAPESYSRVFYESYSDSSIGWRTDARRFMVMFGDNTPRDTNLNEGVVNPPYKDYDASDGSWCNKYYFYNNCTLDPGPDGILNTPDDLDLQTVLNEMNKNDITLLFVYSGYRPELKLYWDYWTSLTGAGGQAVSLGQSTSLTEAIVDLVSEANQKIDRLTLETEPAIYQDWLTFTNKIDLKIPATGLDIDFEVMIAPPLDAPAGDNHFDIKVVGDGAVYNTVTRDFTVPERCGAIDPTPTDPTDSQQSDLTIIQTANVKGSYQFTSDKLGSFNLTNGARRTFKNLTAGSYSFAEDPTSFPKPHMSLVRVNCVDDKEQSLPISIDYDEFRTTIELPPSQTITCTVLNEAANYSGATHHTLYLPIVVR